MMPMPENAKITAVSSVMTLLFTLSFFLFRLCVSANSSSAMQIGDLREEQLVGLEYRPRESTAPLPNIEAEGSQALPSWSGRQHLEQPLLLARRRNPRLRAPRARRKLRRRRRRIFAKPGSPSTKETTVLPPWKTSLCLIGKFLLLLKTSYPCEFIFWPLYTYPLYLFSLGMIWRFVRSSTHQGGVWIPQNP